MADPPDGLLGRLFPGNDPAALYGGALTDPATQAQMANRGLLAMAGSFADSAMPTRMPTPFGAVLGHAAAALGTSGDAVMAARLQEAQSEQARAAGQLLQGKVGLMKLLPGIAGTYENADGGGGGSGGILGAPAPGTTAGGAAIPGTDTAGTVGTGAGGKNNPGNIKTADGGFQTFPTPEAGVAAIGDWGERAQTNHGLTTVRQLIDDPTHGYAPQADPGNRGKPLVEDAARAMGVGPDDPIDLRDPNTRMRWTGAILQQEGAVRGKSQPTKLAATDTAPAPAGLLADVPKLTGQMNAPIPGVAPPQLPQTANTAPPSLGPGSSPTVSLLASTLGPQLPPGAAGAPLPPPLPPPRSGLPPPSGLLGPDAGIPSPNTSALALPPSAPAPPPPPAAPGPQSLVPAPPPPPPVPPAARPAATPPPAAAGAIPGAPSPAKIAAARKYEMYLNALGLPVPADVSINAAWNEKTAEAVRDAQLKLNYAGPMAAATLPADIVKARAGPAERGEQARITYGDEMVEIPGLGWTQRKNLPGFTMAGGGGGGGAAGTALPAGAAGPAVLAPATTPAQAKLFETNLAQATEQLKPLQAEGLAAPQQITSAEQITDLLGRTAMGWRADSKQQAGMIMRGLGVSDDNIKSFLGVDPTAGATLNKLFLKFSSDAVLRLGSREAASVLGQFAKTYPSLESDPKAAELMTNALRMEAQWRLDRANAADAWDANQKQNMGQFGQNYKGMAGFHESFNKTNDPQNYWRAALAMSGFQDLAFRGTSDAQQQAIFDHIPAGRQHVGPNGQPYIKPVAQ